MTTSKNIARFKIYFDRARTYASYVQLLLLLKLVLSDMGITSNLILFIGLVASMLLFLIIGYIDTKLGIRRREMENNTIHNPILNEMYKILKDEHERKTKL